MRALAVSLLSALSFLYGCSQPAFRANWYGLGVPGSPGEVRKYVAVLNPTGSSARIDEVILNAPCGDRAGGWQLRPPRPIALASGGLLVLPVTSFQRAHPSGEEALEVGSSPMGPARTETSRWRDQDCRLPVRVEVVADGQRVEAEMPAAMPTSLAQSWVDHCAGRTSGAE